LAGSLSALGRDIEDAPALLGVTFRSGDGFFMDSLLLANGPGRPGHSSSMFFFRIFFSADPFFQHF